MSNGMDWDTVFLTLLAPLSALGGVWLTLRFRGQETRQMRREAYAEWLKAVRSLAYWDGPWPPPPGSQIPTEERKRAINDLTTEIGLIGSKGVIIAGRDYIATIYSEEVGKAIAAPIANPGDLVMAFDQATAKAREAVARAMRRDLGVRD